ncbi:hypothetical protein B9Z19DRAFT_1190157 [Tuber borchii]|uniref:Uncharacterized protein n=1 Tax=Tuber borchii TaxID=42251 RepID=A0A2T7A4V7_TUBBO|nr:hypothetical protein B9Z19DRAFT_1190157 [Tuber borchii]
MLYSLQYPSVMPSLCPSSNTQSAMLYYVESQPYSPKQELQEIEADPSGGYGFASNPQIPYDHLPIMFPGYSLAAYERPQNLAGNDDGSNFTEAGFSKEQHRSPATPPFYPKTDLDWSHEADVQSPYDFHEKETWGVPELSFYPQAAHEKQILGLPGLGLSFQGAADDESDTTSSGPSSPSTPGDCYPGVIVSQPQPFHEASYDSTNLGPYQSTPGSFSDTNYPQDNTLTTTDTTRKAIPPAPWETPFPLNCSPAHIPTSPQTAPPPIPTISHFAAVAVPNEETNEIPNP